MKILRNIKDLFEEDEESKQYSKIFLCLICYAFLIAIIFRVLPYGEQLEIKDYFNFAGSFGGAIIGGFISLIILRFTLKEQKKQFENQKNIEDSRRKEDKEQFEYQLSEERKKNDIELNIKIINDKISNVKEIFMILKSMITLSGEISYEICNTDITGYEELFDLKKYNDDKLLKLSDLVNEFNFYISFLDDDSINKCKNIEYIYDSIYDNINLLYKDFKTKEHYDKISVIKKEVINKIYKEIDNIEVLLNNIIDYCKKLNEEKYKK